ncbi:hypothetical protein Ami103574_08685 [Aminipila butyrica]|uniref:DUF4829 domain-containing protein n=1 Tax=Aminipila butyrica TaxID=433296 RepID=A0A858BWC5_9FIRM|nr:hypothetical protein [Aminipila butyrica]QIB69398.1 hypothetical protein Ami103574_08685 [Aminipila butyrica]
MKKYYHLLTFVAVIVIITSIFSGFTQPVEEDVVSKRLEQRTSILQKAFYNQITKEKAEAELEKIETYPILTDDIKQLRAWEDTEIDVVKKMSINAVKSEKNLLEYMTYRVDIMWEMSGLHEDYFMEGGYHVVLKKSDGQYKLSCFAPL